MLLGLLLAGCSCGAQEHWRGLPEEPAAVLAAYQAGWEQRDAAAIRATFAGDVPGLPGPDYYAEIFAAVAACRISPVVTAATADGTDTWRVAVTETRTLQFTNGDSLTVAMPVAFTLARTAAGWKIVALRDPA
ncbi:MAG TPA: hypothetical protein PKM88_13925 [bacterium]|nr:hypothetical protein [bacterium]